jgi:hypothetical protein
MNGSVTRSFPARIVAISFVVLILLGNGWFVLAVNGWQIPGWFRVMSKGAVLTALMGGLWLAALGVRSWRHRDRD